MTDQEKPAEETTGGADQTETFTPDPVQAADTAQRAAHPKAGHPPHPLSDPADVLGPMPEYREEPVYLLLKQKRSVKKV